MPSALPAIVFIRLVDGLEEWGSRAGTEKDYIHIREGDEFYDEGYVY